MSGPIYDLAYTLRRPLALARSPALTGKQLSEAERWHDVGDPGEPSFGTGWFVQTAIPPFIPGFRLSFMLLENGWGLLSGRVMRNVGLEPVIFVLPETHRPVQPVRFATNIHETLEIEPDGEVRLVRPNTNPSMNIRLGWHVRWMVA